MATQMLETGDMPVGTLVSMRARMPDLKKCPARGQPHTIIKGAGHFIQETHGPELAQVISDFIVKTPARA